MSGVTITSGMGGVEGRRRPQHVQHECTYFVCSLRIPTRDFLGPSNGIDRIQYCAGGRALILQGSLRKA